MSIATVSTIRNPVGLSGSNDRFPTIAKHAVIGGAIGAAAGAALSFTALPFVGVLSAPLAAAIGGTAGLVVGGLVGFLKSRSSSDHARAGVGQLAPPAPGTGSGANPQLPPPLPR